MAVTQFDKWERNRQRGMAMLEAGSPPKEVAKALRVSQRTVYNWIRRGSGPDAAITSGGRTPKLSEEQSRRLLEILDQGAVAYGFEVEMWTAPRIAYVIEHEFSIRMHTHWIPQMLKRLGWSRQKPQKQAIERDEQKIDTWLKENWPQVRDRRRPRAQH